MFYVLSHVRFFPFKLATDAETSVKSDRDEASGGNLRTSRPTKSTRTRMLVGNLALTGVRLIDAMVFGRERCVPRIFRGTYPPVDPSRTRKSHTAGTKITDGI